MVIERILSELSLRAAIMSSELGDQLKHSIRLLFVCFGWKVFGSEYVLARDTQGYVHTLATTQKASHFTADLLDACSTRDTKGLQFGASGPEMTIKLFPHHCSALCVCTCVRKVSCSVQRVW